MLIAAMDWGSLRRYMPLLSAAAAALVLYRLLESGAGFTPDSVFSFGLYGAALVATPLAVTYLIGLPRQRKK